MIYCVAGVDTDIGKTIATGMLAHWFSQQGLSVITQKLVQTGCNGLSEDILVHRRLMGSGLLPEDHEGLTCSALFSFPASPHLAAAMEGKSVDIAQIVACTRLLAERYETVLVEGIGGLMVPLTGSMTTLDLIAQQRWPVILVTTPRLGSINHTLLSLAALNDHEIPVAAVIYNRHFQADTAIVDDTRQVIQQALTKRNGRAPLIDLPAGLDLHHASTWDDTALCSLM